MHICTCGSCPTGLHYVTYLSTELVCRLEMQFLTSDSVMVVLGMIKKS